MRLPTEKNSFHAQHSAVGAHSSFTLGMHGAPGGLALEKGQPADGAVYVGTIVNDQITVLPFFEHMNNSEIARFDHQNQPETCHDALTVLEAKDITRDYRFASDHFITDDIHFEVISPFGDLPDPSTADQATNKRAACPVVFAKLTVDNRQGKQTKTALFALGEHGCPMPIHEPGKFTGFLFGNGNLGFATDALVEPLQTFDLSKAKKPDGTQLVPRFGGSYGFMMDVAPGECREMHISLGTFRSGTATLGLEMPYWYTRFFTNLRDVLEYALEHKDWYYQQAAQRDAELEATTLSDAQKFLIAHASHSYYGSTQWFDDSGKPFWNVNEGEYRMHNTFDLTVDMLFYEMRYSPWTVKNVLETFIQRYSYYDEVRLPNSDTTYPGGISFTHDQGNHNNFSPEGYSSYEISGIDRRCFSYMTHEQLVNWICCTGVYVCQSQDRAFLTRHLKTVKDSYTSMLNRDHPAPTQRTGVMGCESSRCNGGGEITTYDSLDSSLGQARNNLYLAVKSWAAYLALAELFRQTDETVLAQQATASAKLCAATVMSKWDDVLGYIPAVFEDDNQSAIIPAIEGLVFPQVMGLKDAIALEGPHGAFIATLKRHFLAIFKPGICLYPDQGWKLSSTADNSWMSKICLSQYVARSVFGIDFGQEQAAHDQAHMDWQIFGSTFNACSDQFSSGKAMASLYYPRIVTNILWLTE
ncbi:glycoside hydrolase family 52 protein [Coraliomargarita sp. SDUM461004]|uniref:Glycoside hydrolase family 52 protein n=1 Tax=Thalassobacterium sedimentorum TaxID=3041258 RepID=A0ABU1AGZ8_9BACT|nr:glycoside hydrolase family 52 protein [Coraliomargarita sp. SDUM461004]MDQ8192908.1 glycoside hydrolase family 52 protein [Coraliomargarita sp. SDUM461004]